MPAKLKGFRYRKSLEKRLILLPWEKTSIEHSVNLFNVLYISSKTNVNFMFQKQLRSHIGTKFTVPFSGALAEWATGKRQCFTIFEERKKKDQSEFKPVAIATVCNIDDINRNVEIKFVIIPSYYGKGYTRLVFRLLLFHCFEILECNNVLIRLIKDRKTYQTSNSILKYARKAGVLLNYLETSNNMKHVYLFQVMAERWQQLLEKWQQEEDEVQEE